VPNYISHKNPRRRNRGEVGILLQALKKNYGAIKLKSMFQLMFIWLLSVIITADD